ncbi:unnamed protein product (macronuclear) [Paramecium tetraurelia]|uniref:Transmembrane protein 231 n=1 Tax=Paramecium tetraurelia TaxID=5888 RepID=A0E5G4_PARTE|nr:uncharacterized protein GSPATT00003392001 [Paramecium tetraurelia]CAK90531.1 unnamed protein product [Paramecium tetraurelia]|eukprot:XP_001457928.1 hypothetical protein (macronuclear) [Paramecium tetraurelia strain d4-2]
MVSTFEEQLDIEYEGFHFVNVITSDDLVYHFTNQKYQKIDSSEQLLSYQYLTLQGSKISALMDDTNADNVPEQLNFDFQLFTDADKIKQVTILLPLRCYFASLHTMGTTQIDKDYHNCKQRVKFNIYQQEPLPSSNFDIEYYSEIIVDDNLSNQWMSEMLSQIYTRTYSIRPRFISRKIGGNSEKQLRVSIKLDNIKMQLIQRWVSLLAIMKLAWLQYFSVFIIDLDKLGEIDTCKVEQL